jgi:hypothetical protein
MPRSGQGRNETCTIENSAYASCSMNYCILKSLTLSVWIINFVLCGELH